MFGGVGIVLVFMHVPVGGTAEGRRETGAVMHFAQTGMLRFADWLPHCLVFTGGPIPYLGAGAAGTGPVTLNVVWGWPGVRSLPPLSCRLWLLLGCANVFRGLRA